MENNNAQDLIDSVEVEYTADEMLSKCFKTWAKNNFLIIVRGQR